MHTESQDDYGTTTVRQDRSEFEPVPAMSIP
jgi:hypothetical protein